jgi:hypothetical protein
MNKREHMYQQINQHGQALLDAFPNAKELDPIKLCKKLRRLELKAARLTLDLCNGAGDSERHDAALDRIAERVVKLLAIGEECGFFVNRDPRGYALKVSDTWMRDHGHGIHRDWGGYGILAPDFTNH